MITDEERRQNELIKKTFLVDREIEEEYKLPLDRGKPFGYIYCIENKKNGKKYIGSTYSLWKDVKNPNCILQLRKRLTQYIYEYNCVKNMRTTTAHMTRPIIQALVDEGVENFIMYPLAETEQHNHLHMEDYFIRKYDTFNKGYNINKGQLRGNTKGRPLNSRDKILRSDEIMAININDKKIMFSDSMRLFADYIGSSKDMIKNCNRLGRQYKGWFIFYTNYDKRIYILNHFVLSDDVLGPNLRHSEKSKQFYSEMISLVNTYLYKDNTEYFSDYEVLEPLRYSSEE